MIYDIIDVIKNIETLYENNSSLAIIKDCERVLEEMDMYAYANWEDGELAYGPKTDRYWITLGFMWPRDRMPDPIGGKRLLDIDCKVSYKKSYLIKPRPIRTQADIRPGTKKGRLDHVPIWIVEITMPKEIVFDMYKGYMDKMRNDTERASDLLKSPTLPTGGAAPMPPSSPGPGMGGAMPQPAPVPGAGMPGPTGQVGAI